MATDEPDLTPYDLAIRLAQGLPVTDVGKVEIARELVEIWDEVKYLYRRLHTGDCDSDDLIHFFEWVVEKRAGFTKKEMGC